ncbi:carbohydrate kinase [Leptolyngbya sp. 'hensonii']|uniref:FGGY-family carbohydrate kinase n=1 Tax=Leptolyngbya sp. 'hensonii' TaxID=1922337 RepID=UPI00094FE7A3|nr:FGGY-family carbohydrate kinase [Leptolyngbya sp. 'hensonii']OLP15843.1 carbohydrate kinase [Leptolyngbya sp. 'hensonii']
MNAYLGIDFGTSGARAIVIDSSGQIAVQGSYPYLSSDQQPEIWHQALFDLIEQIPATLRSTIAAIALNGTSATVLLCDGQGQPIDAPILYNDDRGAAFQAEWSDRVPPNHVAASATSSLAKLLWWQHQPVYTEARYFLHQADWLSFLLHGQPGISDYHNGLKLGYDVTQLTYPDWLTQSEFMPLLPRVLAPGTPIGPVLPAVRDRFGLPSHCQVCAGTTDSIAAFLAAGVTTPGQAVTSLGSTLVLKLLSRTPVEHRGYGIYSHRFGRFWLVGGASNTGGAVLNQYFTATELQDWSEQIPADQESPLDYYPLLRSGERFPINDPHYPPRLEPRPTDPISFLHGLLESIARIEARGYDLLQELGATPLSQVYTAGGGAKNRSWTHIRARHLRVPVSPSAQTEAAYGTALLAMRGILLQ